MISMSTFVVRQDCRAEYWNKEGHAGSLKPKQEGVYTTSILILNYMRCRNETTFFPISD